jgi:hypothetical protein
MKSICFFGIYDKNYSRNRVLARGFEAHGVHVIHASVDPRQFSSWKKYVELFKKAEKSERNHLMRC